MPAQISQATLSAAEAVISGSSSAKYPLPKGERRFNKIEDGILDTWNSQVGSTARSDVSDETVSLIKDQVSNFAQNCKIAMKVMDGLAEAHPFIKVAVTVFKAGLQLELTRRDNDDKVKVLNLTMCDMMQTLRILNDIAITEEDGRLSIEARLQARLLKIIGTMHDCAKLCDSYMRLRVPVRFFASLKWQGKFTDIAQEFTEHKAAIQFDLQVQTSVSVAQIGKNVSRLVDMAFACMRSPEEQQLETLISAQAGGAEAVLKNEKILKTVLTTTNAGTRNKSKDGRAKGGGFSPAENPLTVNELKREVEKDVDQVLAENHVFERKFEAMQTQLSEVKKAIERESDRVINVVTSAVLDGPHERIVDKDMYHVWKEMGFKGSTKAKHFVMALHDHFSDSNRTALAAIRDIAEQQSESLAGGAEKKVQEIADIAKRFSPDDLWALQYITVSHAQQLVEALDEDVSSFVTIAEVNTFIAARPEAWSLPRWIAYWAYGFEMTVQWYFRRIRKVIGEISRASRAALPANRSMIAEFTSSTTINVWIENLLSGLRDAEDWDGIDWDNNFVFSQFKSYVLDNEAKLERLLRSVAYYIDEANTLAIVTGGGRPEKYVMPLIFLLLRRALVIVEQGSEVVLAENELSIIKTSVSVLWNAVIDRVLTLKAVYRLQNLNEQEQLSKFFFGLYSFTLRRSEPGGYWDSNFLQDTAAAIDISLPGQPTELPLVSGSQTEGLDIYANEALESTFPIDCPVSDDSSTSSGESSMGKSLLGNWSGTYAYRWSSRQDGLVSFTISSQEENGKIIGSGIDAFGPFKIEGSVHGRRLSFLKEYRIAQYGHTVVWRYDGIISGGDSEVHGIWGAPEADWSKAPDLDERGMLLVSGNQNNEAPDCTEPLAGDEGIAAISADNPGLDVRRSSSDKDQVHDDGASDRNDSDSGWVTDEDLDPEDSESEADYRQSYRQAFLGTFVLERRPVDYLLFLPSEEELAASRPRALWKLATSAIRWQVRRKKCFWTPESLEARRSNRLRFLALVTDMDQCELWGPTMQEWAELVRTIQPGDMHLWRCLVNFQKRRQVEHHGYSCNGCGTSPLRSSRYVCVECSEGVGGGSTDICADCFFSGENTITPGPRSSQVAHTTTHSCLQLRVTVWRSHQQSLIAAAKSVLSFVKYLLPDLRGSDSGATEASFPIIGGVMQRVDDIKDSQDGIKCAYFEECGQIITARPFWCCLSCSSVTLVCYTCNRRIEDQKLWLSQWRVETDAAQITGHTWDHTLVSVPNVNDVTDVKLLKRDMPQEMNARLAQLEERFEQKIDALAEEMNGRLATLENLLKEALSGRT